MVLNKKKQYAFRTAFFVCLFTVHQISLLTNYECENHQDFEFKSILSLFSFVSLQGIFLPFRYYILPTVIVYTITFWLAFTQGEKHMNE